MSIERPYAPPMNPDDIDADEDFLEYSDLPFDKELTFDDFMNGGIETTPFDEYEEDYGDI